MQEFTAPVLLARLAKYHQSFAKWLGYLDQFVLFPPLLWWSTRVAPEGTLFVFADQALGPWIPLIKPRPHLVHVHDLLALEAALDLQPFHHLGPTGRLYQRWIRCGFRKARFFLSVSQATQVALVRQLKQRPLLSEVLVNPLHCRFRPLPAAEASSMVNQALPGLNGQPFLFHIGRNWYKNRLGVLAIWAQLQSLPNPVHLVLVGGADAGMCQWIQKNSQLKCRLHLLDQATDTLVLALYNQAAALLFPSHAEGFGWPILEALACGCPVITTARAPMTEVGGDAATYIPPFPLLPDAQRDWAISSADTVRMVLELTPAERHELRQRGFSHVNSFQRERWLSLLVAYYQHALECQSSS
ncbi:glycosyltransferase [Synechococcus sp. CCY 0621]|uniref:glycosyltransferase n=1 Tax=Synechococcus sp. CCY 0621 TaxID=2815603 RepID=UPI001C232055